MDNIILQKTWVQGCPVIVDNLLGTAFTGEAQAHTFVVSGVDAAQEPVTITGTITGKFLAANNVTVPLIGSLVNGAASVTLTDECYDVPGRYILSIYATNGSTTQCLYCAVGNVFRTDSQTIAYPSTDLPNITTLMAQLEEILDGWPADYSQLQNDVSSLKSALGEVSEPYGDNIFNPYNYSIGHSINSSTGAETNSSGYNLTDYIDIGDATQITFKLFSYTGTVSFYVAYYSTNDVSGFLRRIGNSSYIPGRTMNLDTGTKYIRIAFENEKNSNGTVNPFGVVVVKGEQTIATYIPYLTALDKKARELPGQYWGAITGTTIASNNKIGTYTVGGYNNTPTSNMTDMPVPDFGGGYLLNSPVGRTGSSIRQDLIEIPTSTLRQPRQFTRVGTGAWFGVGYYNWVAYGDSITHGSYSNESGQTLNGSTYSYAWRIAKSIKRDRVNNFYNCAVRGIGWVNTGNNNETLDDMLQLYTGDKDEINLVTVMLGINDYLSLEVIGDENSTEKDGTISGNIRYGLHWICENYPNAKVVVISPLNSTDHGSISTAWSRNLRLNNPHTLQDVSNIIKYWCDVYCVKYINELSEGFINVYNAETILKDEIHPTTEGQWLLAYDLAEKIGF